MPERLTARELAFVLHEQHRRLLTRIVRTLGEDRCVAILVEALTIESHGGMLTRAGDRRRSVGGVFLHLCRERATAAERAVIFRRADRHA